MIEVRRDGRGAVELNSDDAADVTVTATGVQLSPGAVAELVRLALETPHHYPRAFAQLDAADAGPSS